MGLGPARLPGRRAEPAQRDQPPQAEMEKIDPQSPIQNPAARYLAALNLKFCPPREASYMSPPLATVKMAMPPV
jgi:hypothetical protein